MFSQFRRWFVAALVAVLALLIGHWFDVGVLLAAIRREGMTFDPGPVFYLISVAHLLTAAGVVALAVAAWRSQSLFVGVGYAVVGGFLVFLPPLVWAFATGVNGAPPVAPQPIANTLGQWYFTLADGVTGSVFTLAGAMLLSGLAVIGSVLRTQRRSTMAALPAAVQAPPSEPA
jgi:hypothetical protein